MKLVSKLSVVTGVIALAMVPIAYAVDVSQVYVTAEDSLGWVDVSTGGGTATYVDDAPAGFGKSSTGLTTNVNFTARAGFKRADFNSLASLTKLSYWTKQLVTSDTTQTANLEIDVDLNNDAFTDTVLVYNPASQVGGELVTSSVWQLWDATDGQFTSSTNYGSGESQLRNNGDLYNFSQIKAWYPEARVQLMGFMIGDNLRSTNVYVDGVTLGTSVYDFERVAPEGEDIITVPKTIQECKDYGWETLFKTEGGNFRNQGDCVSYIVSSKAKAK